MGAKVPFSKEEMLALREKGMTNKQIADELGVCIDTVLRKIGKQPGIMTSKAASRKKAGIPIEEILALREQGLGVRKISEKLGTTSSNVSARIRAWARMTGIEVPAITVKPEKAETKAVNPRKHGMKRPDISDEEIRALREQGLTLKQIGEKLGTTFQTVSRRLINMAYSEETKTAENAPPVTAPEPPPAKPEIEVLPKKEDTPKRAAIELRLFDFAYIPNLYDNLQYLAKIACTESWRFKMPAKESKVPDVAILDHYLRQVFNLLAILYNTERDDSNLDNIIYIWGNKCCFNTGLVTKDYEPIYMLFENNRQRLAGKEWYFTVFSKKSEPTLFHVKTLPKPLRNLITQPGVFDPTCDIRINFSHITTKPENLSRIPEMFQNYWNLSLLIETAIQTSRKKALNEPQIVVTAPYLDKVSYLLPLFLSNPEKPDLVAVLEAQEQCYLCRTCLTPQMAYLNARLTQRPSIKWLTDLLDEEK